jgi:hypothetical protein
VVLPEKAMTMVRLRGTMTIKSALRTTLTIQVVVLLLCQRQ